MQKQKFWHDDRRHPVSLEQEIKEQLFLDSGHVWREDEDGFVVVAAYHDGNHNGPICTVCGYAVCWHCQQDPGKCSGKALAANANNKGEGG